MKRTLTALACAAVLMTALGSCHRREDDPVALGHRYVEDAAFRREILEHSLVNPHNGYSQLRLKQYREDRWGALPEWNPPVQRVGPGGKDGPFETLDVDGTPWTHDALVALGREAFFRYPVQIQDVLRLGLKHPDWYGLWQTPDGIGGVVREQVRAGPPRLAQTCATCHAFPGADGRLVAGLANARLDIGALLSDGYAGTKPAVWGPGRVDLTPDNVDNPTAIPDLRAVRSERYLHRDGTIRNGLIELAIRIETQIITSSDASFRPPRKLAFAMALFLWELQPSTARAPGEDAKRGEQVFSKVCARCHVPPAYSGERVPLATIGTDPTVGLSPDRGTGGYRVPTLRGVGDRSLLLSGGQVSSLEAMLDPHRPQPGHRYGMDLLPEEKRDLLAFLRALH